MAVEVFNLNYYVLQASSSDPKNAVTTTRHSGYMLSAAPTDRIFAQHTNRYMIAGGIVPEMNVQKHKFFAVNGPTPNVSKVVAPAAKLFMCAGGNRLEQAKVFSQRTRLYEITS